MKFIHTADLHLNSALTTHFNSKLSQKLNNQIFLALENLISFANTQQIKVVLICGDLFDNDKTSVSAQQKLKEIISLNKRIKFIFIYGNHDYNPTISPFNFGENFIVLSSGESIYLDGVRFCALDDNLRLQQEDYNVVLAHGDSNKDFNLTSLKNKNVDYLALGHIHQYSVNKLDHRGYFAYCGSLTARGFDELGKKGFIVVDTQLKSITFKEVNCVNFYEIKLDLTNLSYSDLELALKDKLAFITPNNAIKVTLYGEKGQDIYDLDYLKQKYEQQFLYVDVVDKTTLYNNQTSGLISEFLSVVESKNYTPELKNKIINLGLKTLK